VRRAGRNGQQVRRPRRTALEWVAGLVTGRPKLVIGGWLVGLVLLAAQGVGIEDKVETGPIFIDGSETQREHTVSVREFGSDTALIVMLRGPAAAIDRQGPTLVRRLDALPETLVNSPWDSTQAIGGLRPRPEVAGLVVSVGVDRGSSENVAHKIERRVGRTVEAPVRANIAGGLPLGDAQRTSSQSAADAGERLAIPVLLLVLLFVCRSFIAAAMPVAIAALVVAATKGVLDLGSGLVRVDSLAIGAAGMLGLALGVDYSLLVVSRFREEFADGDVAGAVGRTVRTTGRSVIPAGCGLVLAMLVASQLLPGAVISSVAVAVITASVLSVLSALFATPAILMVLGKNLDRWSLPRRRGREGQAPRWTRSLSARPGMVLAVVFALFLCAVWAFTLQTNLGTVKELPPDDSSRIQHEEVQRQLGPGWIAPLEVVMDAHEGPVTSPRRLRALTRFQRRVEDDPGVDQMAGFASLRESSRQFAKIGPGLQAQERGIVRIGNGLTRVRTGSLATSKGFAEGESGAHQLNAALGEAAAGSGVLSDRLRTTASGSEELDGGLREVDEGSGKLSDGAAKSSAGAGRLARALNRAEEQAGQSSGSSRVLRNALRSGNRSLSGLDGSVLNSQDRLVAAQQALARMSVGRGDSQYGAAVAAVAEASRELAGGDLSREEEEEAEAGVRAGIEKAESQFSLGIYLTKRIDKKGEESQEGIAKLAKAARRLDRGLDHLASSSEDLSEGVAQLSEGGAKLSPGLRKLAESAARLTGGLGEIGAGSGELAGGLGEGARRSTELTGALGKLDDGAARLEGPSGEGQFAELDKRSPGLFRSGYFFLAGLDGGTPESRSQAGFLINLGDGGSAARMLVIPRYDPNTEEAEAARDRLRENAAELADEAGAEVVIGGVTPAVVDANEELRAKTPLTRLALSLVTVLVLLFVTRSLVLPLIAALLNLLTVSATFGLLSLLFNDSLLGGPGYVDAVVVPASIILIFGLAIDYEVFIFARMREEYLRSGSAAIAVREGLGRSASVVTGAALIMISVFLTFALAPISTLRGLGVALALGVFIDAFLIRFVILPATMTALGERSWWMPRWLDRLLPGGARPAAAEGE
jgi:RND superfamily putative drug exporter